MLTKLDTQSIALSTHFYLGNLWSSFFEPDAIELQFSSPPRPFMLPRLNDSKAHSYLLLSLPAGFCLFLDGGITETIFFKKSLNMRITKKPRDMEINL